MKLRKQNQTKKNGSKVIFHFVHSFLFLWMWDSDAHLQAR